MTQLGEITEPKIDQTGPPPVGEFTYVDISSVDNIGKRIVEPKRLPAESAPSRARQQLRSGDVLVSMTRPNLNAVALVPAELDGAVGSTGFLVLRARNNVLPHWLYYGVQTRQFVGAMSELVQGALYPAVRPKDIRAFDLPAPTLDEQRRIVAEIEKQFSRLDKAVANLKRVLINARNYERATIRALTAPGSFEPKIGGTVSDIAISLVRSSPCEVCPWSFDSCGSSRRWVSARSVMCSHAYGILCAVDGCNMHPCTSTPCRTARRAPRTC